MVWTAARYSGAGNTFLVLEDPEELFPYGNAGLIQALCLESQVDGIVCVLPSCVADARMRIFNPDGTEAEMCGNGARCLVAFLEEVLGKRCAKMTLQTFDNCLQVQRDSLGISIRLGAPTPIAGPFAIDQYPTSWYSVNTGVPHAVTFVADVDAIPVVALGKNVRHHPFFSPAGTNVNFAQITPEGIKVRTYERGVENETAACGTGMAAVALTANWLYGTPSPVQLIARSGDTLTVVFECQEKTFTNVWQQGPTRLLSQYTLP